MTELEELRELVRLARIVYDAPSRRYMMYSEEFREITMDNKDYSRFGAALLKMQASLYEGQVTPVSTYERKRR